MVGKICERGKSWVLTNDKLPHTSDALLYHIKRCHYQALVWRQAHVQHPVLPRSPETVPVGWKMKETSLTPELSLLPPVPRACEELISCTWLEQNFAVVRIPYISHPAYAKRLVNHVNHAGTWHSEKLLIWASKWLWHGTVSDHLKDYAHALE